MVGLSTSGDSTYTFKRSPFVTLDLVDSIKEKTKSTVIELLIQITSRYNYLSKLQRRSQKEEY